MLHELDICIKGSTSVIQKTVEEHHLNLTQYTCCFCPKKYLKVPSKECTSTITLRTTYAKPLQGSQFVKCSVMMKELLVMYWRSMLRWEL